MIYIASPYAHESALVRADRVSASVRFAGHLMKQGVAAFSPIGYGHVVKHLCSLPDDHEFWLKFDKQILARADAMYVLMLEGWGESRGVQEELEFCKEHGIPVRYFYPDFTEMVDG